MNSSKHRKLSLTALAILAALARGFPERGGGELGGAEVRDVGTVSKSLAPRISVLAAPAKTIRNATDGLVAPAKKRDEMESASAGRQRESEALPTRLSERRTSVHA